MSGLIKYDASEQIDGLTTLCDEARQAYMIAAAQRSRMAAAIVRAKATRQILNAAMSTPEIVADLLAMADPEVGMVEVVGENISNESKVRVMALALWNGFIPGQEEFAIFRSPTGANLYIKEAGYRKMLIRLGASNLRVNAGLPVQRQIKDGPTIWAVEGDATCEFDGELFHLQFAGNGAITLPCKMYRDKSGRETNSSDQVDGLKTKAVRRMLKELWRTLAAIAGVMEEEDAHDDATASPVVQRQTRAIEAKSEPVQAAPEIDIIDEVAALQVKLSPEHAKLLGDAHADIAGAVSEQQLRTVWEAINAEARQAKLDKRALELLIRIKDARKGELAGG